MLSSEEPLKTVINSYLLGILEVLAPINRLVIAVMDYCRVINPLLARKPLSHREVLCLHGHSEKYDLYHVYCFNNIHKTFILHKSTCTGKWPCCKILILSIHYCLPGLKMGLFVVTLNFKDNASGLLVSVHCGHSLSEKCQINCITGV